VNLHLLAVGKLRPALREAADEYVRRLRRFARLEEREVREAGRAGNATAQRREETRRLEAAVPDGARVVALTRGGDGWSSGELARRMARWRTESRPLAFVIGGAEGLDEGFTTAADSRWSLGALTLPHELARVVVLEQLYRGFTILAGSPYHKGPAGS
jgi:23S rRNA (pseudouridine1915-N3)-methyltransferase